MSEIKQLSPAAIEARRAYNRKWAAEHRENIRENKRRYWERKADSLRQKEAESGIVGDVIQA